MQKHKARIIEITVISVILAVAYWVAGRFDLLERLVEFTNAYEQYELDEFITIALVLVVCLLVLSVRLLRSEIKDGRTIREKNAELQKALEEIKVLKGLIPICSFCKKIRDDSGSWDRFEIYVESRSEAEFTHSVCPECMDKHYPDIEK